MNPQPLFAYTTHVNPITLWPRKPIFTALLAALTVWLPLCARADALPALAADPAKSGFLLVFLWTLLSILAVIVLTSRFKVNSFIALFIASLTLGLLTLAPADIVKTLKEGFGNTMASIGLIIIFGTIIGVVLDKTGAAQSIANYILSKTGVGKASRAIAITGFITGLPIFCDSGFIILSGIARSFSRRGKLPMPIMAAVLGVSLYSVHCLIPPHPGATAAAGIMGVNMGHLILTGILVAIPTTLAAYLFVKLLGRHFINPVGASPQSAEPAAAAKSLPSPALSFLPIVIPLLLISVKSSFALFKVAPDLPPVRLCAFIGEPVIALLAGALVSLLLIQERTKAHLNELFTEAIDKAGPILIIIAAGGMFGAIIKATGVGEAAGKMLATTGLGLLIPFLITSILKTAQGSSTVAIITAASIVNPMLANLGLDSEPGRLLATLAMGSGSMMISHANDAYFWVITRFSGIEPNHTLRFYSTTTIVMGCVSFAFIFLLQFVLH